MDDALPAAELELVAHSQFFVCLFYQKPISNNHPPIQMKSQSCLTTST